MCRMGGEDREKGKSARDETERYEQQFILSKILYCNFKVSIKTSTLYGNESGNFFCIFFILNVISHPEINSKNLTEIEKVHFVYASFFFIYF